MCSWVVVLFLSTQTIQPRRNPGRQPLKLFRWCPCTWLGSHSSTQMHYINNGKIVLKKVSVLSRRLKGEARGRTNQKDRLGAASTCIKIFFKQIVLCALYVITTQLQVCQTTRKDKVWTRLHKEHMQWFCNSYSSWNENKSQKTSHGEPENEKLSCG